MNLQLAGLDLNLQTPSCVNQFLKAIIYLSIYLLSLIYLIYNHIYIYIYTYLLLVLFLWRALIQMVSGRTGT